ncbi:MAG: hypothetical protein PVI91_10585 [Gammaproteobacteria bacterium]|jgi:hypothetical protein
MHSGRLAYNEAIIETENQQILLTVVRNRYQETSNLLAVSSVTANVSVTTSTGIELGFGDDDNFAGNLVPFSGGVIYEENPTISYVPVGGSQYAQQLMSPVPVATVAQLTSTRINPALFYTALVARVNGIHNPDFLTPSSELDPRFGRFVEIMTELTRAHHLHWVQDSEQNGGFEIVIDQYAPAFGAQVRELLNLLGLPGPQNRSSQIVLPVSLAVLGRNTGGIAIITRSILNLLEILSAAIEVPEKDQADGITASFPSPGLAGQELRIRYAKTRPKHASVAVEYRSGWFYIDERDQATKQFFRLLSALLSVAIAESTATGTAAPVLTVPVSR